MKRLLYVFGTRPEAIKLAPLVLQSKARPNEFETIVCATGQHKEMLDQVLEFFDIKPDYDLAVMKPGQTLFDVTTGILSKIEEVINKVNPDVIIVQGDTTTAFVGALAGFYKQIKVAHVEAGLRTGNIYSPFPEEANRVLISRISDYHFPPTELSRNALLHEHVPEDKVFKVGNTVTDAIIIAKDKVADDASYKTMFKDVDFSKKIILVTAHRRESFGLGMENICKAFKELSERDDVEVVFPVHLNPNVREIVNKYLSNIKNVHLYDPFDYPEMVWIMNKAHIVLTDSGGIQEEAPSLGKPVLVLREVTERPEGIDAGTAMLVGTDKELIIQKATELLDNADGLYDKMAKAVNPYGDGHCSEKILDVLTK
jgi:UDP-N-acetylglucosamine 2-epimerase (non-hydrolysing)